MSDSAASTKVNKRIISAFACATGDMQVSGQRNAANRLLKQYPLLKTEAPIAYNRYAEYMSVNKSPDVVGKERPTSEDKRPYQVRLASKYMQLWNSSQKRKKEFNLTLRDVNALLHTTHCFYTGVRLTREKGPYKLTVDRLDHQKGYIKGNVVACCCMANTIKNELFENPDSNHRVSLEFMKNMVLIMSNSTEYKYFCEVYITKYALTKGILKAKAKVKESNSGRRVAVVDHPHKIVCFYGNDFHLSLEAAKMFAEELKIKKLQSLDKQQKRVSKLKFNTVEVFVL